jgi:DNA polymerase I
MRSLFDLGVDVRCLGLDTAIAAYLLDPAESRYLLDEVLRRYAGAELPTDGAASEGQLDLDGSGVSAALRTARYALAVERLIEPLTRALDDQHLRELNDAIEVPLVRVLARMEHVGVGVDAAELRTLRDRLWSETESLRAQIWEDAGTEFNVNSTPQLREILFDKLGLAPQKKTKTGYSTDASSLEKLAGQHAIIDHLLAYREVEKLRSTYGDGLLAEVAPDGRIHATFNQTVARTGRLSSDQPNLHNIPVRSEIGRTFRRAFVPAPGCELLVADYNQIELRCIAHLAEDPGLVESFRARRDIHTETASRIFGVEPGEVTIEQRSKAKMVSYGLAYGMEAYGLGQRLNIPTEEAALILAAYFEAFPAVRDYMDRTVAEARQRGYTETLFGRRRQIPELSSPNFRIRQAGERQAMNAGIQGLAADIFKVALVRLDRALEEGGFASRLVLQVHDEVLLEVPEGEQPDVGPLTVDTMRGAAELRVPLEVNVASGPTWADAKG